MPATEMKVMQLAFCVGSLFILLGVIFQSNSSIETETYDFDITARARDVSNIPLNDFFIRYNFADKTGRLSFAIYTKDLDVIVLNFPRKIDFNKVSIYRCEYKNCSRVTDSSIDIEPTRLLIEDIKNEKSYLLFKINFETDLSPSGRFTFLHDENPLYGGLDKQSYLGPISVELGLGTGWNIFTSQYNCIGDCIHPAKGIKQTNIEGKTINIRFDGEQETWQNSFVINTESGNYLFWGNFFLAIGIALLAVCIEKFIIYRIKRGINEEE